MAQQWFQATRRADGHEERIAGEPRLGGSYDRAAYPDADWVVIPLNREPGEHDRIEGGKVVRDAGRAALAKKDRRARKLTRLRLVEMIEALQRRVRAIERAQKAGSSRDG